MSSLWILQSRVALNQIVNPPDDYPVQLDFAGIRKYE